MTVIVSSELKKKMSTMRKTYNGVSETELLFFFIIIQISAILRYIRIKRHSKITSFIYKKNSVLQSYKTQSNTEINKC